MYFCPWRGIRPFAVRGVLPLLLGFATGCVDTAGKFDDFLDRDLASRARESDAGQVDAGPELDAGAFLLPRAEQISGSYLSVVSTVLSPKKPVVYLLEIEATEADGGLTLSIRDRALSYMDRRTPVTEFSEPRIIRVPASGAFVDERLGEVTPGGANAVLPGSETVADIVFRAQLEDAEFDPSTDLVTFWCGTLSGMLTLPIMQSLEGSTFTTIRITDPALYPDVVIDCAKTPAEPLP